MSRWSGDILSTDTGKSAVLRIEMSPLRGLKSSKRTCFPNAHALGYLDTAAPRLLRFDSHKSFGA
jgi:hypothetical protein